VQTSGTMFAKTYLLYIVYILKHSVKLPITFQQLEGDGFHIFTEIKIFDDTFFMLIDTGASKTVFSEKMIDMYPSLEIIDLEENMAAGIGEDKISAKMARIPLLQLGKIKLHNHFCGLISFENINAAYHSMGLKTFEGIIGGDILHLFGAQISYKNAHLQLFPL
jgi:hypothetical protein